jgi:hypothetical protein
MHQGIETTMDPKYAFITAFWAGLAAPVGLYAVTPNYLTYVTPQPIGYGFVAVGSSMTEAFLAIESVAGHAERDE